MSDLYLVHASCNNQTVGGMTDCKERSPPGIYKSSKYSYTIHEEIGKGAYGKVYRATRGDLTDVALKVTRVSMRSLMELDIMRATKCKYIVPCLDSFLHNHGTGTYVVIVMPLMPITLHDCIRTYCGWDKKIHTSYLKKGLPIHLPSMAHRMRWLGQIAAGLVYLRDMHIMQIDLKADNVMLFPTGNPAKWSSYNAVLIDFGYACWAPTGYALHEGNLPTYYRPPELYCMDHHNKSNTDGTPKTYCDIQMRITDKQLSWMLGVMSFMLCLGVYPFKLIAGSDAKITKSYILAYNEYRDNPSRILDALDSTPDDKSDARSIMIETTKHLLEHDPGDRMSIDTVVFMTGLSTTEIEQPTVCLDTIIPLDSKSMKEYNKDIAARVRRRITALMDTGAFVTTIVSVMDFMSRWHFYITSDNFNDMLSLALSITWIEHKSLDNKTTTKMFNLDRPVFLYDTVLRRFKNDREAATCFTQATGDPEKWFDNMTVPILPALESAYPFETSKYINGEKCMKFNHTGKS